MSDRQKLKSYYGMYHHRRWWSIVLPLLVLKSLLFIVLGVVPCAPLTHSRVSHACHACVSWPSSASQHGSILVPHVLTCQVVLPPIHCANSTWLVIVYSYSSLPLLHIKLSTYQLMSQWSMAWWSLNSWAADSPGATATGRLVLAQSWIG